MNLSKTDYKRIRKLVYRNARPVDLARWKYHFEKGSQMDIVEVLSAYQNEDGGFGHALEADSWNPNSTPIQTTTAIEKLTEINFNDNQHPVVLGILNYLDSGAEFVHQRWNNTVASNNDYPHAPWWHTDSSSTSRSEYNPTATIVGFILEFADRDGRLFKLGMSVAEELIELFLHNSKLEMHPLKCLVAMINSIEKANLQNHLLVTKVREEVNQQITPLIQRDSQDWHGYSCRPSTFIKSPDSSLYEENKTLVSEELDYLLTTRNADGVWDLTWKWNAFDKEFAISEHWWTTELIIENMLFLRAFDRLQ